MRIILHDSGEWIVQALWLNGLRTVHGPTSLGGCIRWVWLNSGKRP